MAETARRVVDRSQDHAGKGQGDVVGGGDALAPLVVFRAHHRFLGQVVRVGPDQSVGRVGAMQVDHQLVPGRCGQQLVEVVHHFLVGAVHEVDLDALDAPLLVGGQGFFHLPVQLLPLHPQPYAYAFVLGVIEDGGQVHGGNRLQQVRAGLAGECGAFMPAGIDQDVFQPQCRGEVDVGLVGVGVHAGIGDGHLVVVPPVPCGFAGLDPAGVLDLRGLTQGGDQGGFHQLTGTVAHHDHAPRRTHAICTHVGAHGGFFQPIHATVEAWRQADVHAQPAVTATAKPGAGIVAHVGFGQGESGLANTGLAHQRRVVEVVLADARSLYGVEFTFMAVGEFPQVESMAGVIASKAEARGFILDGEGLQACLCGQEITQGHAVIVDAHHQLQVQLALVVAGELERAGVVVIGDIPGLASEQLKAVFDAGVLLPLEFHLRLANGQIVDDQAQRGGCDESVAIQADAVGEASG